MRALVRERDCTSKSIRLEPGKFADLAVLSQDILTVDASALGRIMQKNTYH
jgi:predicted amidohydrolase YtcJ